MYMYEFNSGDLVKLKSGSPIMTIDLQHPNGMYLCIYFDEISQNFKRENLNSESLNLITQQE